MPSLFVIQGRNQGQRFDLDELEVSIGRVSGNSIQLNDTEVSRKHAVLQQADSSCVLRDLNSSNGTFVNGKPIQEKRLASGDRVQVGRTLLLFTGDHKLGDTDASEEVSIVAVPDRSGESRILHAISQTEGADLLATPADQTQSPWLARARSNLQLMYRTSLAVSHTLDIDQLLTRIMDMIFEWVEPDRGCILLLNEETGDLEPSVHRGSRPPTLEEDPAPAEPQGERNPSSRITISKTILDYVIDRREGVLTSNAGDDDRWDPAKSIMQMRINEAICVPMQGRYGLVGVAYIDTSTSPRQMLEQKRSNKFSEEHLKLMVAIAHQAALAVEDTSHYQARVQAERLAAVGQTIATLSHHIKNILQGVRGGSYLVELGLDEHAKAMDPNTTDNAAEDSIAAVDKIHKGWTIVEKNQQRISSLVMDMLTYSKEREPDPEPAELNGVIDDVVDMMQTRAAERGVRLDWVPDPSLPTLMIDPEAIHRAILNLVSNGIDACEGRDPAVVEVATQLHRAESPEGSDLAHIRVQDSGIGIEPDKLKAIFTAFVSGKGSKGTGLGLPVCRKIAEEHQGNVTVTSELGAGSTFVFELPIVPAPQGTEGEPASGNRATFVQPDPDDLGAERPSTPTN